MIDTGKVLFLIVLTVAVNTIAQILLKQGSQSNALLNLCFIGGVFLYALSTFFYMAVLKQVSLSVAYPTIIGMTIVSTTILNSFMNHEKFSLGQLIGISLIICGITTITTLSNKV
jgi:small multidrug resistance pump